jgi:sterol desaturase/sphingolipid hydroxylase (fatty acid hydroxylase superfamily)
MISLNSLKNFVYLNGILIFLGMFEYNTVNYFENLYFNFFIIMMIFLSRNYFLLNLVNYNLKDKENLHDDQIVESYPHEFNINLITSTSIETITYMFIKSLIIHNTFSYYDILLFIPYSFIFELLFDFFHYWSHRILHTNKFLYVNIHKKHHKYAHPKSIITFYQDPLDLLITNSVPQIFTLLLFPYISLFLFNIILSYKSFLEISGHSGKKLYPNGSFIQFIWLPKILGITLYTEDHNLHHSLSNCNYSKRFSLWDKVFGTYKRI